MVRVHFSPPGSFGNLFPHLENCTGKKRNIEESAKAGGEGRIRGDPDLDRSGRNWRTQADREAGEVLGPVERSRRRIERSSEKERRVDARALIAEEGRDKLRKAMGSRK